MVHHSARQAIPQATPEVNHLRDEQREVCQGCYTTRGEDYQYMRIPLRRKYLIPQRH